MHIKNMKDEVYIISARKYRPTSFKDVIGQEAITNTLDKAITNRHLAKSLLFCGPHGVGKTTCARILAKKVNGLYQNTLDNISNEFNIFELDAASNNSVDDIRALTHQFRFAPQQGKYKVYIIDEVHMLSQVAFNAFLKTLEEPPPHAIFVLATTEKHKVLPTIISRCQVYEFRRISLEDIYRQLKKIAYNEGVVVEEEAFYMIAQRADGALRDALSIFDRLVCFSGENLTADQVREQLGILNKEYYFKSVDLILSQDIKGILILFNQVLQQGFDGRLFISGLAEHLRDLMVASHSESLSLIEIPKIMQDKYIKQASHISPDFLIKALQICQHAEITCKSSINPRLLFEISLMQLASFPNRDIQNKKKNNEINSFQKENCVKQISTHIKNKHSLSISNIAKSKNNLKVVVKESHPVAFSIQEALTPEVIDPFSVESRPLAKEVFSKEDFIKTWEVILKDFIPAENIFLKHVLSTVKYEILKNNVVLYFVSKAALIEFSRVHESILKYLRDHMNNSHLSLETCIRVYDKKKIIYTPEEKFAFLQKKNPQLKKLKEYLDLDFYN